MKPGRRPTPDWLAEVKGNPNKRPPKPEAMKAPVIEAILPPARFGDRKRALWSEVCKILSSVGALSGCDSFAIQRYVDAIVEYEKSVAFLDSKECGGQQVYAIGSRATPTTPDINQEVTPRLVRLPHLQIMRDMDMVCRRFENDFGLNPSARTQILSGGLGAGKPENPNDDPGFDPFDVA